MLVKSSKTNKPPIFETNIQFPEDILLAAGGASSERPRAVIVVAS